MYARVAAKSSKVDSFGWKTVAGRQRPKYGQGKGHSARPQTKRQRTSTGSGSSPVGASNTTVTSSDNDLSLEQFKSLDIDDKLASMFVCLQEVKSTNQRLLKAEQTVHEIHEFTLQNKACIETLAYKSIDMEARQRRNNLLFWGIPEVRNEDCTAVLSEFLSDRLEIDAETICIQTAHRVGRPINNRRNVIGRGVSNQKHRPLIALFRDFQDVELIISNAGKLRGTSFGINRDYPPEIIEARKPLLAEKKKLKAAQPNSNISIQYPAKLIQDGRLVKDMLPNWQDAIRRSRLKTSEKNITSEKPPPNSRVRLSDLSINKPVFQSESSHDNSDMEHSDDDSSSAQPIIASAVIHAEQADNIANTQVHNELHSNHVTERELVTEPNVVSGVTLSNEANGRPPNNSISGV